MNRTKLPYMIVKIEIPNYNSRIYHGLLDTGATSCLCKKETLPDHKWKNTDVIITGIGGEKSKADGIAENIVMKIAKEEFKIPRIYTYKLEGIDFLIGASFYDTYLPIEIYKDFFAKTKTLFTY